MGGTVEDRLRRDSLREGGRQHEGLEGRPRLPAPHGGDVELLLGVVPAPDDGLDVAGRRVDGHQGGIGIGGVGQRALDGGLGPRLHGGVQRRADLQAPLVDRLLPVPLDHVGPQRVEEPCPVQVVRNGGYESGVLRPGLIRLGVRDGAEHLHPADDSQPVGLGAVGVEGRGVVVRRVDDAGEQRRLRDRELGGGLAEVGAGRHLGAVGAAAEVHGVEVPVHDLGLADRARKLKCDPRFHDLPPERRLIADIRNFHVLLSDRRSPLDDPALLYVGRGGSQDGPEVHAGVGVVAGVLLGHHRGGEVFGDLVERHRLAVDGAVPGGDQAAVAREHVARADRSGGELLGDGDGAEQQEEHHADGDQTTNEKQKKEGNDRPEKRKIRQIPNRVRYPSASLYRERQLVPGGLFSVGPGHESLRGPGPRRRLFRAGAGSLEG